MEMLSQLSISLITETYVRFWHEACLRTDVMGATQVSTHKVSSRGLVGIKIPKDAIACQFYDVSSGTVDLCGKKVTLQNTGHNGSEVHYLCTDAKKIQKLKRCMKPVS